MIDPAYWRPGLAKDLRWLRKARTFRRWSEKKVALFERRVFLAAGQIHVLVGQSDVPPVLVNQPLGCVRYGRRPGEAVGRLSQGDVPAVFQMESPHPDALTADALCRHVIHPGLVGAVSKKPRRFTHLWVVTQGEAPVLYELEVEGLLEFFGRFAEGPGARRAERRGRRRKRGKRGAEDQDRDR